jgi:hypothetical protein
VGVQIDLEIGPIFWVNNLEPYKQEVYFPLLHLILFVYALIGQMIQLDNDMCLSKKWGISWFMAIWVGKIGVSFSTSNNLLRLGTNPSFHLSSDRYNTHHFTCHFASFAALPCQGQVQVACSGQPNEFLIVVICRVHIVYYILYTFITFKIHWISYLEKMGKSTSQSLREPHVLRDRKHPWFSKEDDL